MWSSTKRCGTSPGWRSRSWGSSCRWRLGRSTQPSTSYTTGSTRPGQPPWWVGLLYSCLQSGQSSAKLPVILSPSHLVIWSFGHLVFGALYCELSSFMTGWWVGRLQNWECCLYRKTIFWTLCLCLAFKDSWVCKVIFLSDLGVCYSKWGKIIPLFPKWIITSITALLGGLSVYNHFFLIGHGKPLLRYFYSNQKRKLAKLLCDDSHGPTIYIRHGSRVSRTCVICHHYNH